MWAGPGRSGGGGRGGELQKKRRRVRWSVRGGTMIGQNSCSRSERSKPEPSGAGQVSVQIFDLETRTCGAKRVHRFWEEEVPGITEQCRLRRCEAFQGLLTMAKDCCLNKIKVIVRFRNVQSAFYELICGKNTINHTWQAMHRGTLDAKTAFSLPGSIPDPLTISTVALVIMNENS